MLFFYSTDNFFIKFIALLMNISGSSNDKKQAQIKN